MVAFGERIIAVKLAARGLSRGHSKYKKVLLVGAYAPVSSAPDQVRSGQVRYITRPKSEAMRVTRQLRLPPRDRRVCI